MAGIKWIKLATNMHDDEKIKLIDAMPERDTIHYVWIRILLLGGKLNANGEIFLSEGKPLTAKMLAILFSRSLEDIKISLKVLSNFGMIEIAPDKVIKIVNWDKHQNIEGMERVREQNRKRAENHREKKKLEKIAAKSSSEAPYEDEVLEEGMDLEEKDELQENGEETYTNNISAEKTNAPTNEACNNNILETADNNYNAAKNTSNPTQNESNVTVTEQNKKEIESKKQNKKEKKEIDKDINHKALELMQYHEKITGKVGGCDYVALRSAINLHGEKLVKMAMDIGFEKNCPEIKYAIGILKNWRRDGYPKDNMEVKTNGFRCVGKSNTADKNEFAGFKPKEPRKLTETQRKRIEANLI